MEFNSDTAFGWIDLNSRKSILLAVSGGSDSTALLIAFKRWADRAHPALRLVCATVDHGLRSQSGAEAGQVGSLCRRMGIEHLTRRWTGTKPDSGLAEAAREARYALLAEAAREVGTDIILTGHTADDQAETVLMRSARGSGRGLAGMARVTLYDREIWITRPFLMEERDTLRRTLRKEGVLWIDDPTNVDEAHERVRIRQQIQTGPEKYSLIETARLRAVTRSQSARTSARLLEAGARLVSPGLLKLDLSLLNTDNARTDVWRVLLACTGGRAHLASRHDIAKLIERLGNGRSCLSGSVVVRKRDAIYLHRELRGDGRLGFRDNLFDGRYQITPDAVAAGWRLAQRKSVTAVSDDNEPNAPANLLKAAMMAEPVLVGDRNADPGAVDNPPRIQRYLAPFDHFLPEFDLTLANSAANLYGRDNYPRPPVSDLFKPES